MLNQICWKCGKPIPHDEFNGQTRRYCESCYDDYTEEYKPVVVQYSILRNRVMFERAMRLMEKARVDMTRYKKSALAVMKHSRDNPEKYRSSDEMISAIVLLEDGHDIQMNASVGHYIVDILISDMKIVLEIDGDRHKTKKGADGKRDVEIRHKLGAEWEVVRIPTKYVEQDPEKIPDAIRTIYAEMKRIRKANNGLLPETFSRRHKDYYEANTIEQVTRSYVI